MLENNDRKLNQDIRIQWFLETQPTNTNKRIVVPRTEKITFYTITNLTIGDKHNEHVNKHEKLEIMFEFAANLGNIEIAT